VVDQERGDVMIEQRASLGNGHQGRQAGVELAEGLQQHAVIVQVIAGQDRLLVRSLVKGDRLPHPLEMARVRDAVAGRRLAHRIELRPGLQVRT
jgi:hypothetical protein